MDDNAGRSREAIASEDQQVAHSLYATAEKIYPRQVHGLFAKLRVSGITLLLTIFYGLPWLSWNGQQMLLLDLPARKFHIFGLVLWPQDFIYLAFMLIIAGLLLFFVTALAGRVWCGYACPQTVWTEAFLWVERKIEGTPYNQKKLDAEPMSLRKATLKITKHTIWLLFSLWTGFTFVGYFSSIQDLGLRSLSMDLGGWEGFWIFFYGFATYGNAGWMREQVCLYMCPYARFQSAMFDVDTLIISYDKLRGEPRGGRKRSDNPTALELGSCIDCTLCVQVCPTGIDIRNGLQYECIACSACVDACDGVMDKMGYEPGLIKYTTQNAIDGKPDRIIRPRIIVYAVILMSIMAGFVYSIDQRVALDLDVIHDRNRLYRETDEGLIENVYVIKILNMDQTAHRYTLAASGIIDLELHIDAADLYVEAGEVRAFPVRLRAEEHHLKKQSSQVTFDLRAKDSAALIAIEHARFLGPRP
ncbi:MAG TPA: cytochrome c oxidase accessory protein CcoG [Chromatiales bacterium]|jgi:cytochrome c oxidase accessory protein FixG|nr:cytochrome c oxidase accessory protein CcoG [Chromatiaceae bacterium]HIB84840.1 cytochrome c oxidase accessory protein CcoG [Chromatiaceae bacterium]HIN81424.1 cytochrome c oxidase accessory protein CcoG [Chromatiales bacterium]HIO14690.1 cytochrome c oxidase accessory protein CcoG [Chromatiales bacterium]HIO53700.1 cytochrome c oxidase accessory protein CcoG [Chromatiales bacterium]